MLFSQQRAKLLPEIEKQEVRPGMSEDANRNEDGKFKAGNNANPEGINGHLEGWQRYGTRLQKWMAMPGEEIARLVGSTAERNKLSSIDIACVRQAAAIIGGEQWLEALRAWT